MSEFKKGLVGTITPEDVPTAQEVKSITKLGEGGFGAAYSLELKGGKRSVIKVVNPTYPIADYGYSPQEIMLSNSYRHPNLVHGIGLVRASDIHRSFRGRGLAIVLSQYDTDLLHYLNNLELREEVNQNRYKIALNVIHGYRAMRELGWLHLDIKPQNMLVRRRIKEPKVPSESNEAREITVVLADFGTAKPAAKAGDRRTGLSIGTPMFMPPEAKAGQSIINFDEKFDIYSLGVTLDQIFLTAILPPAFSELKKLTLPKLVARHAERWTLDNLLSSDFYSYLSKMSPDTRYESPQRLNVDILSSTELVDKASRQAARLYPLIIQEAKKLSKRFSTLGSLLGDVLRNVSIEVVMRAQILSWMNLSGVDPTICLVPPCGSQESTITARVLLWIAYKMVHTAEVRCSSFFGPEVDCKTILAYEEQFMINNYDALPSCSLFDLAASKDELVLNAGARSKEQVPRIFTSLNPLGLLSLNAGGKNVTLVDVFGSM